jgi:hypothetical protein
MIQRVKFKNKLGYPMDMVLDIIEEEKKFIYAKYLENNSPILISRKDIDVIVDAKVETKK